MKNGGKEAPPLLSGADALPPPLSGADALPPPTFALAPPLLMPCPPLPPLAPPWPGRVFFRCSLPEPERSQCCGFMWADEVAGGVLPMGGGRGGGGRGAGTGAGAGAGVGAGGRGWAGAGPRAQGQGGNQRFVLATGELMSGWVCGKWVGGALTINIIFLELVRPNGPEADQVYF